MYVVVQHRFIDPETAFARGERLINNEGVPEGAAGLEFYPSQDGTRATCLWEAPSVEAIQAYVDETLGDSSENLCYGVNEEQSFATRPAAIAEAPSIRA
jgi:hypothetical protein